MNSNLTIDVNVNPNGVASPTQTKISETPESNQIESRTAKNYIATSAILSVVQRGIGVAASNIGAVTGNRTAARKASAAGRLIALTYAAATNPAVGLVAISTQLGTQLFQTAIENRNVQNEANYNRALRTATYNNGRK
jgi:hypothetical protein